MGRKVNPIGFRLAVNRNWESQWFARKKEFADCLVHDYQIRQFIRRKHRGAMISRIDISRVDYQAGPKIEINAARLGLLIGTKGEDIGKLREEVRKITGHQDAVVDVKEVRNSDTDASLIAQSIASRLEKRQRTRRVIQSTLQAVTRHASVLGVKIRVKGRLEGADIARMNYRHEGRVPLHTLRADIDYGFAEATTQMGQIGVKVWVYRGERDSRGPDAIGAAAAEMTQAEGNSGLEAVGKQAARRTESDVQSQPSDQEFLRDIGEEFEDEADS